MCGRFVLFSTITVISDEFEVDQITFDLQPSYNIAPGRQIAAVTSSRGTRRLEGLRWGLVPSWAKDPSIGNRMINARGETVSEKPSFRRAFKSRRCLIVADGFYEWRREGAVKVPFYVHMKSKRPFAFAGLFERWTDPAGNEVRTCAIITTAPNELLRPVHDRMPVILTPAHHSRWIDPDLQDEKSLTSMLNPYPPEEMTYYEVSRFVNSPKNDSPRCIQPAPEWEGS